MILSIKSKITLHILLIFKDLNSSKVDNVIEIETLINRFI